MLKLCGKLMILEDSQSRCCLELLIIESQKIRLGLLDRLEHFLSELLSFFDSISFLFIHLLQPQLLLIITLFLECFYCVCPLISLLKISWTLLKLFFQIVDFFISVINHLGKLLLKLLLFLLLELAQFVNVVFQLLYFLLLLHDFLLVIIFLFGVLSLLIAALLVVFTLLRDEIVVLCLEVLVVSLEVNQTLLDLVVLRNELDSERLQFF